MGRGSHPRLLVDEPMAGYSKRTLVEKLGIRPGARVAIAGAPDAYEAVLGPLPEGVEHSLDPPLDFVHVFAVERAVLERLFLKMKPKLAADGMLWASWPKKAAKVPTDLDENVVRRIGLDQGLVDVKVAAVDDVWSGLKFVYRLKDRPGV